MLAPLSWLKEYVEIDVTPEELQKKLFSCGFEVEELYQVGKDISGIVVGLVETCEPIEGTHLGHAPSPDNGQRRGEGDLPGLLRRGQCRGRKKVPAGACRRDGL